MAPFGGQDDRFRGPGDARPNPADWSDEDRARYEELQRREQGILLLKVFAIERMSHTTNCPIKIWKIIVIDENMDFHRFRIFEYLNYRIFEFPDDRFYYSKAYYLQKRLIMPISAITPMTKGNILICYFCKYKVTVVYSSQFE